MVQRSGDVHIEVPAVHRSLRLLRLAVADAADDMGYDVDGIEAVRIAVDELAAILLATGEWETLTLTISRDPAGLVVEGAVAGSDGAPSTPAVDGIVSELLAVCVADYALVDGDRPGFTFRSQPPAAQGFLEPSGS